MKIVSRAAKLDSRWMAGWLVLLCVSTVSGVSGVSIMAQSTAAPAPATTSGANVSITSTNAVPGRMHSTLELDGPWRFQVGDDPDGRLGWAEASFDDSAWTNVTLSRPLSEQGFDTYTGYGWYRLRLRAGQLAQFNNLPGNAAFDLLVTPNSIGQFAVYVNGVESGHTQGMTDQPAMYQSPPLIVHLGRPQQTAQLCWPFAVGPAPASTFSAA
jgi:hypothetical protein